MKAADQAYRCPMAAELDGSEAIALVSESEGTRSARHVAAVALGVLQRMGRTQLLAWGAAAWVGLGGLYEIYLRSRYDIDQSGSWPRDMRTAHELAWMGLALLMAYTIAHLAVVLGRADRAEPDPEGVATPS